jgi:hypothetical protein
MLLACFYEGMAEIGRHSLVGAQPTDTVLVDGQMMSKEAIPFDGRAEIRPDDNVHTILNQL